MKVLLALALFGVVFASQSAPTPQAIAQQISEQVSNAFATQDLTQLNTMCAGGSMSQYLQTLLQQFPAFAQLFQGLDTCLNPLCGIVASNCWSSLQSNLPQNTCVPSLATSVSVLQNACDSGCFTQLNGVISTTQQCLVNWAANAAGGLPITLTFNLAPAASAANLFCTQNPADSVYCITKLSQSATLLVNAGNIADPANCPYFESLGCCATGLRALLNVFNGTIATGCSSGSVAPFTAAQLQQALNQCTLQNVASCPLIGATAKIVVVNWVLNNLNFAAFQGLSAQLKLELLAALRKDFAASTGLDAALVSVGTIIQAATGINVKFIIRAATDLLTNTNFATYTTYITGSATPSFTNTDAFAGTQSGLTTGGVQYNSAASSYSLETQSGAGTSGASSVVSSMALLFAIIAMAFAFLA